MPLTEFIKELRYFCKFYLHGLKDNCLSLDFIWLNWFCNCREFYSWRGPRKHKFCRFGCLEEWIDRTVCLLSLQSALTVHVWLRVVRCPLHSCCFVCTMKSCCCCTLLAVVLYLLECDAERLQHLPLHSITLLLFLLLYISFKLREAVCIVLVYAVLTSFVH